MQEPVKIENQLGRLVQWVSRKRGEKEKVSLSLTKNKDEKSKSLFCVGGVVFFQSYYILGEICSWQNDSCVYKRLASGWRAMGSQN